MLNKARSVEDIEEGRSIRFATLAITMYVDNRVTEDILNDYLRGVGDARRSFEGYVSRKLIEVPCEDGRRLLLAVVKFSGDTAEKAYENMMRWERSEELARWIQRAQDIPGIDTGYAEYQTDVGNISLEPKLRPKAWPSPPIWKMSVLIEFWVFITEVFNYYAGTFPSMLKLFENSPFTLLVALAISVPPISYCALPLTLKIPIIARWANRRFAFPKDDDHATTNSTSCYYDIVTVLEDGFGMFSDRSEELEARLSTIEQRLERLNRHQVTAAAAAANTKTEKQEQNQDELVNIVKDEEVLNDDGEGGICIAARHYVAWGCQQEFEAWAQEMSDAMRDAPNGGFLGADVFRESKSNNNVFVTLFRFQSISQLRDWIASETRNVLIAKIQPYTEAPTEYAALGSGLRLWADPATLDSSQRARRNLLGELLFHESSLAPTGTSPSNKHRIPPLYKSTILITLGLFLVVWIISSHLGATLAHHLPHPFLVIFCSTCITVAGNSYFGAPLLNFFFSNWLAHNPNLPDHRTPNPLVKFLVLGTTSTFLQALLLFIYFGILILAGILKNRYY